MRFVAAPLVVAFCVLPLAGCGGASASPPAATGAALPPPLPSPAEVPVAAADVQVADPVRLRIPAIGVDAPVAPLELENGVLPAPGTTEGTGWWRAGPEPGERGRAVIVGHVDSYQGPAVFSRLREMGAGDEIVVERVDGTTARFVAVRAERHDKDAFPTEAVYGDTAEPQLRLVTCGGEFDRRERSYRDNVIVFASAAT